MLNDVVVLSTSAGFQYDSPGLAGLMPPSVPVDPAMFLSPLISGGGAVAEFGFAMLTKCELVVVTDVDTMSCGATGSSTTSTRVVPVASASESAAVPMSSGWAGTNHPRAIASQPRPPDACGSRFTVVDAPPVVHCAMKPSPLFASWRDAL